MKKALLEKINSLPELPNSVLELTNFNQLDDYDVNKLASIINKDPFLVATILKIANSPMFGFRSHIDTLTKAINLLGINFTISVAIGTIIQKKLSSNLCAYAITNEEFINISSLATNLVNTWVSGIDFDLKNDLLLPAFLMNVGKYIISELVQEKKLTEQFLKELNNCQLIFECEEKFVGYSSARITANVFKQWSFSHKVIFPIAYCDNIENAPKEFKKQAQILHIINILCDLRAPLSDENIELGLKKASEFGFDIEQLLNAIDVIKEVISQNS